MEVSNFQTILATANKTSITTTHNEILVEQNICKTNCDSLNNCPCVKKAEYDITKQRRVRNRVEVDNNILSRENTRLDEQNGRLESAYGKIMDDIQNAKELLTRLRHFRKQEAAKDLIRGKYAHHSKQ